MGHLQLVKGCCPLDCQDTCSWVATVEDGRVTKVAGARDHPVTRGSLCAKVRDYQERAYAPDRLLHPLVRTGPKGTATFRRASWDEALDVVAGRLADVVAEHGPESVLPFNYLGSMGIVQRRALMRLFHALGASQYHGSVCGAAMLLPEEEGHPTGFDPEEMTDARFVLVWGSNPVTTCHHNWHFITEARRRHGARLVVVDPRATPTARAADEHVALLPGTDAVLAAGIARVLFHEGLADLAYASRVVADLDDFERYVEPWTPEAVAAVCGIEPDVVGRLGREFGRARPALIRAGVGAQQSVDGEAFVRSVSTLAVLGGHWQRRGGGLFMDTSPQFDDLPAAGAALRTRPSRSLDLARLGHNLTDPGLDPPVKALVVWGANPAVSQPDAGRVREGLSRGDLFTVVLEHFMTDTARYADVVLPSTTQLEHFDAQSSWGHQYVSVNNQAVMPVGEARSHGEVMRQLARRLGLDHPALRESDEEIVASVLPPTLGLEELKAAGWRKLPRGRFQPEQLTARLRVTPTAPPIQERRNGRLRLLTPKSHNFLNSTFVNMPGQRRATAGPVLDLNPADARDRGLSDGQRVVISNEQGRVEATVRVTDEVRQGVAALPGKWWAADGALVNELAPAAWSPGGQPAYNDMHVDVAPSGVAATARAHGAAGPDV